MKNHRTSFLGRTYRHMQRYRQILTVLVRFGFGDFIDALGIEPYLELGLSMLSRHRRESIDSLTRAERLRMALVELGPTFVKMGQVLSTRPDLLPIEMVRELEKLQQEVPPFPFEQAKQIVEQELGAPIATVYPEFSEAPLAAASIAQVHRARLRAGEDVVVKIQRPDVIDTVDVDLEIMHHLAGLMEKYLEAWEIQQPTKIVDELAHTLRRETDFLIEASHIERFGQQFARNRMVHVPSVHREFSTARVLTMEYVDGIRATDIDRLLAAQCDPRIVARRGADLIMSQVFEHGFFHADPHPGNVFVLPGNIICYVDFGMMGRLDPRTRELVADLVMAVVRRDESRIADAVLRLTITDIEPDRRRLERDLSEFLDEHLFRPLKEIELGKLLAHLLEMSTRHRLRIPPDVFLMIKALSTAEAMGRQLDPDFDIIASAAPFVRRVYWRRFRPRQMMQEFFDDSLQLLRLLRVVPGEMRDILEQARQGKVHIKFEHQGLEPMLATYDRVSNRLAYSIVLASLVIGSSLMVLAQVPPKWNEIPVIGLVGFVVAGIMGFWLLWTILKHGRM